MNKKGFTLVEILAIMAVLGVMVMIVLPNLGGSIESKKDRELEKLIDIIENSAKTYHSFNNDEYKIRLDTLIDEEYIVSNMTNPKTGELLDGCISVTLDEDGIYDYMYGSCDNIEVPFSAELGEGANTSQSFASTYLSSTKIELVNPTKEGNEFLGWKLVKGNSILKGNTLIIGTTETILYALWESYPSLTIDLDGGSVSNNQDGYYKSGTTVELEVPTKAGYAFTGWTVLSGNGVVSGNNLTVGGDDTVVKATWEELVVQAIYSETDNSLTFINDVMQTKGGTYNDKKVTEVYTGFTTIEYDETTIPWYTYRASIKKVEFIDEIKPTSLAHWFRGFSSCIEMNLKKLNTSNVTSLYFTFDGMSSLTTLDLSNFDTSNVTSMVGMFYDCSKLTTLDLSNFDTSNVTSMVNMFYGMLKLTTLDLSSFDTSNVYNINTMFQNCSSLTTLDISNFDTSRVKNMGWMFQNCSSLTTLDLSNFDTSSVTNMTNMFYDCSKLTTLDLSSFNTSSVTNMYAMFSGCSKLTTLDLSNFDTSKVTNMSKMFRNNTNLYRIYVSDKWTTSAVTTSTDMFLGSTSIVGGFGTKYNASYLDKTYAKIDEGSSKPGYFTSSQHIQ